MKSASFTARWLAHIKGFSSSVHFSSAENTILDTLHYDLLWLQPTIYDLPRTTIIQTLANDLVSSTSFDLHLQVLDHQHQYLRLFWLPATRDLASSSTPRTCYFTILWFRSVRLPRLLWRTIRHLRLSPELPFHKDHLLSTSVYNLCKEPRTFRTIFFPTSILVLRLYLVISNNRRQARCVFTIIPV
ncbi:hypothetical protein CC86DRAFT_32708 [Ophiobolus disseminans]|uniref:Uncharacterized protein n=1 Tax=Ophiobolus disseminans TaxID=1469910 RepID=A0A6A6ZYG0_9PLEO|nr:hypothetical protein CC86DRAFT_32708 [Ophiobolus disseminans]